ncbi:uncharacterized protein LOC126558586 [Anopheles maculipalpis]|uniref:uncharacterized protein LOC126558586 n=1 Tax=Anopheles maculipalpis TaxID=1496333 RepID=UPI0021599B2D|nr:uncharacterized protein LOC126558586 [Anopheles maculipalpis]
MNNLPLSNDERHYRNHLWREKMQQQQQQQRYIPSREVPDERVCTVSDDTTRFHQRPTTANSPEHPRPSQGRGRPRREHPAFRISHPVGDGVETDGDIDDTLSEFAVGCYTPRRTRASTMRPSTWKKLNQWLDAHQQELQNEGMGKGRSMSELRSFAEYNSEEEEGEHEQSKGDTPEQEKQNDLTHESEHIHKEPRTDGQPMVATEVKEEDASPKNRSIGIGYQFLKNLMMLLLYSIETVAPVTYPFVLWLKDHMRSAILYLWERFFQPFSLSGFRARENSFSMLIMLLMVPVIALLGIAYCILCILYWMHRLFLIEP